MKKRFILPLCIASVWAQPPFPGGAKPGPPNARRAAAFDPTGYWIAQITEDWRYRMKPAPKGDVGGIPVNQQGRRAAAAWDPEKDAAAGDACKSYGAGGILRMPGRIHFTWEDDNALKMDTDVGTQSRVFAFGQLVVRVATGKEYRSLHGIARRRRSQVSRSAEAEPREHRSRSSRPRSRSNVGPPFPPDPILLIP